MISVILFYDTVLLCNIIQIKDKSEKQRMFLWMIEFDQIIHITISNNNKKMFSFFIFIIFN